MILADRIERLGTETAFAVSREANALAATGKTIYPFHLGDINIKTPANIIEATKKALDMGKTGYCSNYGITELRESLAEDINRSHGTDYGTENVVIEPGGKPTINKFLLALMNPGDEVLYPNPGYPIYESLIEFYGGRAVPYGFREGQSGFEMNLDELEDTITEHTRILIFNDLHNPTAAESSPEELARLADIARRYDLYVLCDEAYFDIRYEGKSQSLVSLPEMPERCVILYSFSKKFAMTGWRLGAAIGPVKTIEAIARLNVNDESCSNHFIQYGALQGLNGNQDESRHLLKTLEVRRDRTHEILSSIPGIHCYKPAATFYLFPNITGAMKAKGILDYNKFRIAALNKTGVSFCTRTHFGKRLPGETEYYARFAYSGIGLEKIEEGLIKFKRFIER